jgi:hypothetical protein
VFVGKCVDYTLTISLYRRAWAVHAPMDKKSIVGFLQFFRLLLGSLQEILYIGGEFIRYLPHRAMPRSLYNN